MSTSTINMVEFYFLKDCMPKKEFVQSYIRLAYQKSTDHSIYPKKILIRGFIHGTTTILGKFQKDPKGEHLIICTKTEGQLESKKHIAIHGYVDNKRNMTLTKWTKGIEKADSTLKKHNNKPVWPGEDKLEQAVIEISYGHDEEAESRRGTRGRL